MHFSEYIDLFLEKTLRLPPMQTPPYTMGTGSYYYEHHATGYDILRVAQTVQATGGIINYPEEMSLLDFPLKNVYGRQQIRATLGRPLKTITTTADTLAAIFVLYYHQVVEHRIGVQCCFVEKELFFIRLYTNTAQAEQYVEQALYAKYGLKENAKAVQIVKDPNGNRIILDPDLHGIVTYVFDAENQASAILRNRKEQQRQQEHSRRQQFDDLLHQL